MKLTSFKCSCCDDRQFDLTVPYSCVFPAMDDSDDYVIKLSSTEIIELFRLVQLEAAKEED